MEFRSKTMSEEKLNDLTRLGGNKRPMEHDLQSEVTERSRKLI